jgi:hypothetical protein
MMGASDASMRRLPEDSELQMQDPKIHDDAPPFWRTRFGIGWLVLAAAAGWFLWEEHRAHLLGALPWLVLLACPLMHRFMHHGHHPHAHNSTTSQPPSEDHFSHHPQGGVK